MNDRRQWLSITGGLLLLLAGVAVLALCTGPSRLSPLQIWQALMDPATRDASQYSILTQIRLPRIILGLAVGGALAVSGVILQAMFRNPLVEPYTLGISGGAALGVCVTILWRLSATWGVWTVPVAGFMGAVTVITLVYRISSSRGRLDMNSLLLAGVMLSYVSSSLFMLIMALVRAEDLQGIVFWIMGSLEQPSWLLIKIMLGVSLAGLVAGYWFCKELNALALGEERASHLGVDAERTKKILFILASGLTGASVAVAGIIGFVGLVVPHVLRLKVGSQHRLLLVAAYLSGGIFLIVCDMIARTIIAPLELPVGVISGIIGGTVFIAALLRRSSGGRHA